MRIFCVSKYLIIVLLFISTQANAMLRVSQIHSKQGEDCVGVFCEKLLRESYGDSIDVDLDLLVGKVYDFIDQRVDSQTHKIPVNKFLAHNIEELLKELGFNNINKDFTNSVLEESFKRVNTRPHHIDLNTRCDKIISVIAAVLVIGVFIYALASGIRGIRGGYETNPNGFGGSHPDFTRNY